ncbi:MAG: hypothetical protein VXU42_05120, partial [Verrucomicrobiota bacterium]|nr:hypothetical protein [Verrucomicrobiota bacterium]
MQVQVQQLKQELEDADMQLEEQVIENEELHDKIDEMGHQLEVERRALRKKSERQKSERARLAKWSRKRGKKQRRQALADMKSKVEKLESRALAAEKRLKKSEAGRRKSEAAAAEAAEKLRKVKGKVKALSETVAAQENTIEELIENYKEALREDTDQHEYERAQQQQQKHHHHDVAHSGTWLVQGEAESRLPHCSAWGFKMRKTIIQLLAIGTAPSKVAATISITRSGAGLEPIRFPKKRFMQAMRSELRGVVELLAVYLCANEDWEWLSSSFDGSNKGSLDLVTFNVKVRNKQTKKTRMVCLRGAMVPENKTAVGELNVIINQQVFVSLRKRLELWIKIHHQMFPGKAHSIPSPRSFSLARLAKSAVKSDGCNQALKMCRLVKEAIITAYIESLDGKQAEWDGLTETEQEEAVRVYIVTCQNHLRATAVRRGIKHEKAFL